MQLCIKSADLMDLKVQTRTSLLNLTRQKKSIKNPSAEQKLEKGFRVFVTLLAKTQMHSVSVLRGNAKKNLYFSLASAAVSLTQV